MIHEDGFVFLRNAIIEQAAKDYVKAKEHILAHPNKKCIDERIELDNLTRWFKSRNFSDLGLGISGEYFIEKMDELAASGWKPMHKRVTPERKKDESCT